MQPRSNSAGQSSYIRHLANRNQKGVNSDLDNNSMGKRRKSDSTTCIPRTPLLPPSTNTDTWNGINGAQNHTYRHSEELDCVPISPDCFANDSSKADPKSRHEFMKTYCNFSPQQIVLHDDYTESNIKWTENYVNQNSLVALSDSSDSKICKDEAASASNDDQKRNLNLNMVFAPTFITRFTTWAH